MLENGLARTDPVQKAQAKVAYLEEEHARLGDDAHRNQQAIDALDAEVKRLVEQSAHAQPDTSVLERLQTQQHELPAKLAGAPQIAHCASRNLMLAVMHRRPAYARVSQCCTAASISSHER